MPVFTTLDDCKVLAKYLVLLKKALNTLDEEKPASFLYLKQYFYTTTGKLSVLKPLLLVDFAMKCIHDLPSQWTAKGNVVLTADGKLKFEAIDGRVNTHLLQKFMKELSSALPQILLDPTESEDGTPIPSLPVRPGQQLPPIIPGAAAVPPNLTPARPQTVLPPAPVPLSSPAAELPVDPDAQRTLIEDTISALARTVLPAGPQAQTAALQTAQKLSNQGSHGEAMAILNDLVKDVIYRGVPAWVLDRPARKYEVEMLTEQYAALLNLIAYKRKVPADGQEEEAMLVKLNMSVIGVSMAMTEGVRGANPAAVKKAYDEWEKLVQAKTGFTLKLKKLWLADQSIRCRDELAALPEKGAQSNAAAMMKAYGLTETLELAQMAEIQAVAYQKIPANKNDEVAQGNFNKKLDISELAAIFGYSTANYNVINKVLRNKPVTADDQAAIAAAKLKFDAYIRSAVTGLAKLPVYKGDVIRCNKIFWQPFIDEVTRTGQFSEASFMSSGKKKVSGFGNLDVHISGIKTGRDISLFSLHQTEGEILFPPGATFELVEAEVTGADGTVQKITRFQDFATYVSVATKSGSFSFKQIS